MILLAGFLRSLLIHRETLILENLALCQQLATYKRTCKRSRLRMFDRANCELIRTPFLVRPVALRISRSTIRRARRESSPGD
jgi:hypothetical protein